jgi:spermidine synthase
MRHRWLFGFFLVSGFCSLVLEVVWLRLAMAHFGVTSALVSIVLSTFMGGLALGSWGAGRAAPRLEALPASTALRLYALAEVVIALSVWVVPALLAKGRSFLVNLGGDAGWGSAGFHAGSALCVAVAMLPFCVCMGATFPLALSFLRRSAAGDSSRSFSYLYVANVVGATAGTLVTAFVLIELLGFRGTLDVAAFLNATLGALALGLSLRGVPQATTAARDTSLPEPAPRDRDPRILAALFVTGLASMGMEVVWVRQLTPYLGNAVYTFATILGGYLAATFVGSALYRLRARKATGASASVLTAPVLALVGVLALLPLIAADPRAPMIAGLGGGFARTFLAVVPFCVSLGFLTPSLMDRWSGGDPRAVGSAYALNVAGCIVGPLLAGFVLLPYLGERGVLVLLALPLFLLGAISAGGAARDRALWTLGGVAVAAAIVVTTRGFEDQIPGAVVRRDGTATVAAFGTGMDKYILVNGIGMTNLTPITKMMAHLPLAFLDRKATSVLVICFGMGTSYRSSLTWDVKTTAVELVPSVPELLGYFHADAPTVLASPLGRIVVDDGRRFLERSPESYDVILIDPPPPVEAAGSSLLYSREFYEAARRRLRPGGIVQQWIPGGDILTVASFVKAISDSFPYVRTFASFHGVGLHLLGSDEPLVGSSADGLAARLPPPAASDLVEWGPGHTPAEQFETVLSQEQSPADLVPAGVRGLTDDHPVNEYYFLRRGGWR